ncbi:MAG: selenocysteine-specific translation elongation factor [Actinomycetota bacterium]
MRVLCTAGHVDHGKSTLIERLSGIDPDRLAEEKARGLTIDLGFAWFTTPAGRELGVVDVPGHERFVHNMLAGVGSLDATLFVVAANEGWKPQSEEHLAILEMMGARNAVVALTKTDLVSTATLSARRQQVAARLTGTGLAGAPIVPVSAKTGKGVDDLLAALDRMLERAGPPEDRRRPRVFIDRSFTVKGVGTVVTGTLAGGTLRVDDSVLVLPAGYRARVRGIQTYRKGLEVAMPVSRVALNLAGLDRIDVTRGDAVVLPDQWKPTTELDVRLRTVRSLDHPLTSRGAFKVHIGSAEVDTRVILYEARALEAGADGFARLVLTQAVVAGPLDRFVLRDPARNATVGGGTILDAHPIAARGSQREARVAQLRARAAADENAFSALCVDERGVVVRADLPWLAGTDAPPAGSVSLRTLEVSRTLFDDVSERIVRALGSHHERHPLVRGVPREDLREAAEVKNARLFTEIVESLADRIVAEGRLLRISTHTVMLSLEEETARDVLLEHLAASGFSPPPLSSLIDTHGEPLVRALLDAGVLVKIKDDFVLSATQLERAKILIAEGAEREGPLTAARIKELLGTSRKFAIPLLEYLDASGFTRRRGDLRELVG